MPQVDILLTSAVEGGMSPYHHGDLAVHFHLVTTPDDLPLLEGLPLVFIDWTTGHDSGLEFCRRLRCDPLTARARITVVLDSDEEDQRRLALRSGADDYMVAPLTRVVLLDRAMTGIGANLGGAQRYTIILGPLIVDLAAYKACWMGNAVPLMPNEFRLLRFFCEHPGRVFTRLQVIHALGKDGDHIDKRTVDVWVGRLRRALTAANVTHQLRTVRSLGYVFDVT